MGRVALGGVLPVLAGCLGASSCFLWLGFAVGGLWNVAGCLGRWGCGGVLVWALGSAGWLVWPVNGVAVCGDGRCVGPARVWGVLWWPVLVLVGVVPCGLVAVGGWRDVVFVSRLRFGVAVFGAFMSCGAVLLARSRVLLGVRVVGGDCWRCGAASAVVWCVVVVVVFSWYGVGVVWFAGPGLPWWCGCARGVAVSLVVVRGLVGVSWWDVSLVTCHSRWRCFCLLSDVGGAVAEYVGLGSVTAAVA